jgi:hypothetical protein
LALAFGLRWPPSASTSTSFGRSRGEGEERRQLYGLAFAGADIFKDGPAASMLC